MHPTMEPASEIMVPMAENIVIARNIPSMAEIRSHVSTSKITKIFFKSSDKGLNGRKRPYSLYHNQHF